MRVGRSRIVRWGRLVEVPSVAEVPRDGLFEEPKAQAGNHERDDEIDQPRHADVASETDNEEEVHDVSTVGDPSNPP